MWRWLCWYENGFILSCFCPALVMRPETQQTLPYRRKLTWPHFLFSPNFVIDEVDRVPVLRPFFAFDFTPTIETKEDFESWIFTLRKLFSFFCLIFYACALCFLSDCNFSLGSPDTDCSSNPKQNKTLLINQ